VAIAAPSIARDRDADAAQLEDFAESRGERPARQCGSLTVAAAGAAVTTTRAAALGALAIVTADERPWWRGDRHGRPVERDERQPGLPCRRKS